MNKVFVIGGDHHNTLGVIRGLGERGILSNLILISSERKTFVDSSKYVSQKWIVKDNEQILDVLLANKKKEKAVVICCSDYVSGVIDENYDLLKDHYYLPGGDYSGAISVLMNKNRMAELAKKIGLPIPQTFMLTSRDKACDDILPCIVKPIISRNGKKSDIQIIKTKADLNVFLSQNDPTDYQIQSFIDKDFEYQLIGCRTNSGDVIIPGVSIILRPCKGSNTSFLHYIPLRTGFCDIKSAKKYVNETGYKGLFSLEFLRDKNGNDYFMEMNFRNDGNAICVTAAGISLPYIWYQDCIGYSYKEELKKNIRSVYIMPDMAELKLLLTKQISPSEYINDFRKTDRFMEFDKNDIIPFLRLIWKELHL